MVEIKSRFGAKKKLIFANYNKLSVCLSMEESTISLWYLNRHRNHNYAVYIVQQITCMHAAK